VIADTLSQDLTILPVNAPVAVDRAANHIRIRVPKNCEVSLVESIPTRFEIELAPGARLTHIKEVRENPRADYQSFLEVQVAASASFTSHVFLLAGHQIRNTIHVRLAGEGAECSLNGLYIGVGEQRIENHTLVEHQQPHTVSRQLYKGILDGQAQGSFDGLVIVQKEAQKTDAAQSNKNLLLSPRAKAQSNPELKIYANDVKCKHGSTIGQLDPAQLFYLRSRGIPADEARRLLVLAFASEMLDPVNIPALHDRLFPCLIRSLK